MHVALVIGGSHQHPFVAFLSQVVDERRKEGPHIALPLIRPLDPLAVDPSYSGLCAIGNQGSFRGRPIDVADHLAGLFHMEALHMPAQIFGEPLPRQLQAIGPKRTR